MEVLKLLKTENSLDCLAKYGISATLNDTDNRAILNYCQIESPKTNPIVRECRGLIVERDSWKLVARSFYRFFNWGEFPEEHAKFNWNNCWAYAKEDGSLINLHAYNGKNHITTRASFGSGEINKSGLTWRQLMTLAFPNWESIEYTQNTGVNLVLELCSRYNKVVRDYPKPTCYILSAFDGVNELPTATVDSIADYLDVQRPERFHFSSIKDVQSFILERSKIDATFEGLVLQDNQGIRAKVKSDLYVSLHRLNNNGNLANIGSLVPLILAGETDEVLLHFPEMKERVDKITVIIEELKKSLDNIWYCFHDTKKDKDFAFEALKHPLSSALFNARKLGGHPFDYLNKLTNKIIYLVSKEE